MKSTSHVLCHGARDALSKAPTTSGGGEAQHWTFRHIPGTRQFALFGEAANHSKVSVHCTLPVPVQRRMRREGRQNRSRMAAKPLDDRRIIPFSCQLNNMCRGFPMVLMLRCETRAGQLVLNGAAFARDATELRQGPEASQNQLTYGGPHLTQTQLADFVLGVLPSSSPLATPTHEEALFFNAAYCFDNSAHNWYGHNPVHTVRPEMTEAIAHLVASFGIDDALAANVADKARLVEQSEKAAWRQMFNDLILKR